MSIREREIYEAQQDLLQKFDSGKEIVLQEQSAVYEKMKEVEEMLIANEKRENELKRTSDEEKERREEFRVLMEKMTAEREGVIECSD